MRKIFLPVLFFIFLASHEVWADPPLKAFKDQPSKTYVTLPWVSPLTGEIWIPMQGQLNAGFAGPEGTSWTISPGGNPSCHFGSHKCADPDHHTGEDWVYKNSDNSVGKDVYAVNNGIVVFAQEHPDNTGNGTEPIGYVVILRHDVDANTPLGSRIFVPYYNGSASNPVCHGEDKLSVEEKLRVYSYYLHLGSIDPAITIGQQVSKGQKIGSLFENVYSYFLDDTGTERFTCTDPKKCYPAHLHIEIWGDLKTTVGKIVDTLAVGEIAVDADGYANGEQDFIDWPLAHPMCFFKLNNNVKALPVGVPSGHTKITGTGQPGGFFGTPPGGTVTMRVSPPCAQFPCSPTYVELKPTIVNWSDTEIELDLFSLKEFNFKNFQAPIDLTLTRQDNTKVGKLLYPFPDVKVDKWYAQATTTLWKNGIVDGRPGKDGAKYFAPDDKITRAEFVTMVVQAAKGGCTLFNPCLNEPPFVDVTQNDWFYPFVKAAFNRGWIASQQTFRPNDPILRSETAAILVKALERGKFKPPTTGAFEDVKNATDWYYNAVYLCKDLHVLEGYKEMNCAGVAAPGKTYFCPARDISRSEAAQSVYKAFFGEW